MTGRTRWALVCAGALVCSACSGKEGAPAAAGNDAPRQPAAQVAVTDSPVSITASEDEAAVARAKDAIAKHQLTAVAPDCLKLEVDASSADNYDVTVYELHDLKCGGDPATQPRLFSMQLAKDGSKVLSDAKSEDGEMTPLGE